MDETRAVSQDIRPLQILVLNLMPTKIETETQPPRVTWRSHANLLYLNWLNYFVYQGTPYDLETIEPVFAGL